MASNFKIGATLETMQELDAILAGDFEVDPDWSFAPYSTSVRLGNGQQKGMGFPIARWRWNGMDMTNRELLRNFVGSDLSATVYIQTATNETEELYGEDEVVFRTYEAIMNWPNQDEDFQASAVVSFVLIFTHLIEQVEV
jgi:hypothetical protein